MLSVILWKVHHIQLPWFKKIGKFAPIRASALACVEEEFDGCRGRIEHTVWACVANSC